MEQLRTLDAESVHTCVTSPPYFGLRDYGIKGQIGLEPTPQEYLERLVQVFREVRRVLRKDGTLWLVIGDSYCRKNCRSLKNKDLLGIPWALAMALRTDGWYLRQDIIWHKPNAMPEGVRDRCTRSHEYIFLLSKSERYYFDADAIRESFITPTRSGERRSYPSGCASSFDLDAGHLPQRGNFAGLPLNPLGRNKRDVWTVPSSSFRGRTSRCSRRSWRNPASWREAPLAARCWTPLWAAVQPALWRNAWAGVLSGSTYPRTTAPWPRNEFRTQRRWCEWEAETGSWTT